MRPVPAPRVARCAMAAPSLGGEVDVVVVGAGLSGLAVANALCQRGASVAVLEARARVGGRLLTAATPRGVVDLGATWRWPGEHRVEELVRQLRLPSFPHHEAGDALAEGYSGPVQRLRGQGGPLPRRLRRAGPQAVARQRAWPGRLRRRHKLQRYDDAKWFAAPAYPRQRADEPPQPSLTLAAPPHVISPSAAPAAQLWPLHGSATARSRGVLHVSSHLLTQLSCRRIFSRAETTNDASRTLLTALPRCASPTLRAVYVGAARGPPRDSAALAMRLVRAHAVRALRRPRAAQTTPARPAAYFRRRGAKTT